MILEVAEITVRPGTEQAFEEGVGKAAPLFLRAKGCQGLLLHRVVETPMVYRLVVKRETVENHMVDFRDSDDFQAWRALVGPFFDSAPRVTHSQCIASHG